MALGRQPHGGNQGDDDVVGQRRARDQMIGQHRRVGRILAVGRGCGADDMGIGIGLADGGMGRRPGGLGAGRGAAKAKRQKDDGDAFHG